MTAEQEQIEQREALAERYESEAVGLLRHTGKLATLRGVLFIAMVISGLIGWLVAGAGPFGLTICLLCFATLVAVVYYHEWLQKKATILETRAAIQRQSVARIRRDWDDLPSLKVGAPDSLRAVAQDLDLFGDRSLFRWICRANTPSGVRMLRDWIAQPADPEEIVSRQAAVKRLVDEYALQEELAVSGQLLAYCLSDPDKFLQWLEGDGWYHGRRWLLTASRVLTCLFLLTVVLFLTYATPRDWTGGAAMVLVAINMALSVAYTGSMHDVFFQVTTPSGEMQHYRDLFNLIKLLPEDEPRLGKLREVIVDARHGADRQLNSLQRIMHLANLRRAGLFGAIYFLLQITVLWDFHIMAMLERWRRDFKDDVRHWFEALGELEALASLAAVSRDHPSWTYPRVDEDAAVMQVDQIGHPLLPPTSCVRNDASVGPQGTLLLVTGSNMSGKSTLLRSLGLNAVLAHTGGVVCAADYHAPPLVVATSMRIVDSLNDGVSFFMAELRRLKEIVDQADSFRDPHGPVLLYLLDEILQGTNSAERRIAVARVAAHLLARRTIGAISTHDLELAHEPQLAEACRPIHFRESFVERDGERQMVFDYRLQEGVAPTTNALALLEMVGLSES